MRNEKRAGLLLAMGLGWSLCANAFDWQPQTSEALRQAAMTQSLAIASAYAREPLGIELARLADTDRRATNDAAWIPSTVACCRRLLDAYPPSPQNLPERQALFRLLDYPLHIDNLSGISSQASVAAYETAALDYERAALHRVLDELEETRVSEGAVVWKLYNMGFVIKTKAHTFAIDITTSPLIHFTPPPPILPDTPPEQRQLLLTAYRTARERSPRVWESHDIDRLATALDAFFITHPHGDHYSADFVNALLDKGKPVVAPFAWKQGRTDQKTQAASPSASFIECRATTNGPLSLGGIQVTMFSGYQGDPSTPNTVYLFDVDGVRVTHNGDNTAQEAVAALAHLPPAQILLVNCWSGLAAFIQTATAADPAERARQVVIPGHENELGHSVPHRESWKELDTRPDRLGAYAGSVPVIPLGWGERIIYPASLGGTAGR